jgi:hypothetical protein
MPSLGSSDSRLLKEVGNLTNLKNACYKTIATLEELVFIVKIYSMSKIRAVIVDPNVPGRLALREVAAPTPAPDETLVELTH